MTTQANMGSKFNNITLRQGWGDLTDEQIEVLAGEVVTRFNAKTGLYWQPATSSIIHDVDVEIPDDIEDVRAAIAESVFDEQQKLIEAAGLE